MNKAKFIWLERASKSELVDSVWFYSAPVAMARSVPADPCISLSLVKQGNNMQVVLRGPQTQPRNELLAAGFECLTIRLQPGVLVCCFSAQKIINSSAAFAVDAQGRFRLGGDLLQFPDFDNAELLVDQLYNLGWISQGSNAQAPKALSARTYARLIKRTTGLSPYQLYQLQRIHKALKLLKQGMPAATVAAELNFVDQSHLTHAARQFLGNTPKQLLSVPQTS